MVIVGEQNGLAALSAGESYCAWMDPGLFRCCGEALTPYILMKYEEAGPWGRH